MRSFLFFVALGTAGAAQAQNMPLTSFVERGTKLEKKGPMALFSRGEIKALQTEMQGASAKLREERLAAEKEGRKTWCPPKTGSGGGVRMDARKLLADLRAIPAAQARTMTTTDGMRHVLKKRYPCLA